MIAVIFEAWPAEDQVAQYLDLAAALRADLAAMEGFISIERYESLNTPGKLLSLSFWRDEDAVRNWRNHPAHRSAQSEGRAGIFEGYRIRVASVMRDYSLTGRDGAPAGSRREQEQETAKTYGPGTGPA